VNRLKAFAIFAAFVGGAIVAGFAINTLCFGLLLVDKTTSTLTAADVFRMSVIEGLLFGALGYTGFAPTKYRPGAEGRYPFLLIWSIISILFVGALSVLGKRFIGLGDSAGFIVFSAFLTAVGWAFAGQRKDRAKVEYVGDRRTVLAKQIHSVLKTYFGLVRKSPHDFYIALAADVADRIAENGGWQNVRDYNAGIVYALKQRLVYARTLKEIDPCDQVSDIAIQAARELCANTDNFNEAKLVELIDVLQRYVDDLPPPAKKEAA
jgi:hypothetical protein